MALELGRVCLPEYPVPDGMTMDTFFRQISHQGLDQRLDVILADAADADKTRQEYRERLDFEIGQPGSS